MSAKINQDGRMQFRLTTLLLAMIFTGSLIGCWILREPWRQEKSFRQVDLPKLMNGRKTLDHISSDNHVLKEFFSSYDEGPPYYVELFDGRGHFVTQFLLHGKTGSNAGFADDHTIVIDSIVLEDFKTGESILSTTVYRRHFPDFWWGHFFRFEVWSATLSGAMLCFIAAKRIRRNQKLEL